MLEIRNARPNDAEAVAALAQATQALHAAALPNIFKPAGPDTFPPAAVRAVLNRPDHVLYVAADAGRVVGYIHAEMQREPETALKYRSEVLYVRQMGVAAAHQRREIGRQLLDTIRREAVGRGLTTLMLSVYTANPVARAFYLRYGFVPYREDLRLG